MATERPKYGKHEFREFNNMLTNINNEPLLVDDKSNIITGSQVDLFTLNEILKVGDF